VPAARILFYVATIGSLALVLRGLLIRPVPTWVALTALGVYVTIVLCGVFFLRLRMFVDAVITGPADARGVALTFDDGPSPQTTGKILDALKREGHKATFFVIGRKAEKHPDIVKRIVAEGHALGSHSYSHPRLFSLLSLSAVRVDLKRSLDVLEKITGQKPTLFRPPIGHTNPRVGKVVRELGLTVVGWSVRALDGLSSADPESVSMRVGKGLEDGAIVLLHDAAERDDFKPASVEALPRILAAMHAKNLTSVMVSSFVTNPEEPA
jgi:peptidoglycan/xylan/chitin deacetylase (PgdA/CDA1 family)